MKTNTVNSWIRRAGDRGRAMTRSAGQWAGRTLPALGQRIERWTASVGQPPEAATPPEPEPELRFDLVEDLDTEPASEVAAHQPLQHAPGPVGVLPDLEVPRQLALSDRLTHFIESVRGATGAYAAFVADSQGLPLVSSHGTDDQIAITAALDRALGPIRTSLRGNPQGSVALEIDRHNVLQIIWVNAGEGRYVVGLVLAQSLGGDFVEAIRNQLVPLFGESKGNAA